MYEYLSRKHVRLLNIRLLFPVFIYKIQELFKFHERIR